MTPTLLSVVVPTRHRPDLLAQCLARLAPGEQSLAAEHYEVVVTDDGTETVEQFVRERFPWARWVQGPRRGPAANRNHGASVARGEWLVFTDDDCLPTENWLQAYWSAVRDDDCVLEGRTTCDAGVSTPLWTAPANLHGGYLWSCNMAVERDCFEQLGGFDETFPHAHMEDVDFRERLRAAGRKVRFVPTAIVDHPPRRVASGWKLALQFESDVYYRYKQHGLPTNVRTAAWRILKVRVRRLCAHPLSVDSFLAALSLAAELTHVVMLIPSWNEKYRRMVEPNVRQNPA